MVAHSGRGWHLAPCLITLEDEIDARWPDREKQSDGTIGDAAHRARESQHNPDDEGVVRALDVTSDPNEPHGWTVLMEIKDDPRIRYVIARNPADDRDYIYQDGEFKRYTRMSHKLHCHISIVADNKLANSTAPWFEKPILAPAIKEQELEYWRKKSGGPTYLIGAGKPIPMVAEDKTGYDNQRKSKGEPALRTYIVADRMIDIAG